MPRPSPRWSTGVETNRPLTRLWTITRKLPFPGDSSWDATHLIRHCPLPMLKESVSVFPRPENETTGRHPSSAGFCAGFGPDRHEAITRAAVAIKILMLFAKFGRARDRNNSMMSLALPRPFGAIGCLRRHDSIQPQIHHQIAVMIHCVFKSLQCRSRARGLLTSHGGY